MTPDTPDEEGVLERVEGRLNEFASRFDKTDWIELLAAIVLAIATILAAWSAYQSSRWSGEQAKATNTANAERIKMIGLLGLAQTQALLDAEITVAWMQEAIDGDEQGMAEFEARLSDQMRPAFDAWLAMAPPGELPPGTPQELPEYEENALDTLKLAQEAADKATEAVVLAGEANQRSDNFVLVAVVMASVMLFAGVGSKFQARRLRAAMVVFSVAILIVGFAFMISMPQNVGL